MNGYRTSFTTDGGMLTVVVDRERGGAAAARFSWAADDTEGVLGELATALAAIGKLGERRARAKVLPRAASPRRPRQTPGQVSLLDGIDQAIELLELGGVSLRP